MMLIKKPFIFILVLLSLCSIASVIAQAEDPPQKPEIVDIAVSLVDGKTEIEIIASSPFTYTIYKKSDPYHITVDLQDTLFGVFTDKIVVDSAGVLDIAPVKNAGSPDIARIDIALTVPADIEPLYRDNTLTLSFDNPEDSDEVLAGIEEETVDEAIQSEAVKTAEERVSQPKYTGEKISIDFQDVELNHVFRLIADISGYNIVISPDVKGKFSMKLSDVPWDQALDIILRNYGLSKSVEANIIRIAPTAILAREEEEIARVKESQEKSGNLVTRVYPINYANVSAMMQTIKDAKILTNRGFISVDERTTSIVIRDVDQKHEEYEKIIAALDNPTPQVSINARIVEVTDNLTKELGIQWGALVKPTPQSQVGGGLLSGGLGEFTGKPLAVNLPAAVGSGTGGTLGIGYVSANALRALDIQLSAAESTGQGKVISSPRIVTMDNQKAVIRQGKKIPYETISQDGTKTEFVDAALELIVVPHITPEGTILMKVEVRKNEADFSRTSNNVPTIDTNEVETLVLINDGDTLALGGIYKRNETEDEAAVPGLGKIPILGWLFKKELKQNTTTEILVFITPRIVK
ncbi:MAG: type IV pilus secretin PilQ [Nitrospiraceae bacterium]|nr:MAG: type IV pilus secretin PilQ [Nitrospiraceae bacterium]